MEPEIRALIQRYDLNSKEQQQLRLNLDNKDYAAFILAAAREPKTLFVVVRSLLTRDPVDIDVPIWPKASPVSLFSEFPDILLLGVIAGADHNQFCPIESRFTTPLGIAAISGRHDVAEMFLSLGVDPNFCPPCEPGEGRMFFGSPLEFAIRKQDRTMVDILLARGADPNYVHWGCYDSSPLLLALRGEDISLVHLLFLHGADWRTCWPLRVIMLPLERFRWFVQESGYSPLQPADEGRSFIEIIRRRKSSVEDYEAKVAILLAAGAA